MGGLFFATAIGLTVINELDRGTSGILERAATTEDGEAPTSVLDALNSLQSGTASDLPVPETTTDPAAPAGTDPVTAPSVPAADTTPAPAASDLPVPEAPTQAPVAPATN